MHRNSLIHRFLVERDRLLHRIARQSSRVRDVPTEPFERTVAVSGAVFGSRRSVSRFADALVMALSEKVRFFVVPASVGDTLILGIKSSDIGDVDALIASLSGEKPVWRDNRGGEPLPRIGSRSHFSRRGAFLRSRVHASLSGYLTVKLVCYADVDDTLLCDANTGSVPRVLHVPLPQLGEVQTVNQMLGGSISDHYDFPVDVVYTWVNFHDPDWNEMYRTATGKQEREPRSDASSAARFLDRDELRHSLRSLEANIPWVRNVFVLTNCNPPSWFVESSNVKWVRHDDVMNERHLPTFNSHAIESYLHHIDGLSNNFIYLNDDVLINKPMGMDNFFTNTGRSISNMERYGVVNGICREGDPDYLNAARNAAGLLRERFGIAATQLHKHTPHVLRRDILHEMESVWPDAFERTRSAAFRSITDVSPTSFLYHHFAYRTGGAVKGGYPAALVKPGHSHFQRRLDRLRQGKGRDRTVCLNDGAGSHENDVWDRAVRSFLRARFPTPSSMERREDIDTEQSSAELRE